jgi:flavodoxin I
MMFSSVICTHTFCPPGADMERSGTGWDEIYYSEMQDLKIAGKKVAVFGLGDSVSYSENYADATGEVRL